MSVALATAWRPRGELQRFLNLLPLLEQVYSTIVVSLPPNAKHGLPPSVSIAVTTDWSHGRHVAIARALDTDAAHIHYADFDRILHWVETRPDEWCATVDAIQRSDCLVIGRSPRAFETHPHILQDTEKIVNLVFSHLLGRSLDLGGGSRGLSRRAAQYLIANSSPSHAVATDSEWIVLLHRAGFSVDSILVDGLDWETPDHRRTHAANPDVQHLLAEQHDADAERWGRRVQIAHEIIRVGLDAMHRPKQLES